jgi:hypothetical protein
MLSKKSTLPSPARWEPAIAENWHHHWIAGRHPEFHTEWFPNTEFAVVIANSSFDLRFICAKSLK